MKNKILQLNNLYFPCLSLAEKVLKLLHNRHVDSALSFCDQVCSRIDDELICRNYPMPVITCCLHNYKTQIGLDPATTANYLGFIKFTLSKHEILRFNFDYLKGFNYSFYSTYNHHFFDSNDIKKAKIDIKNYNDREFRIKTDFSSLNQVEEIIGRLTKKNDSFFASSSYTCICGSHITVDAQNGKCPVCGKESSSKRIYKRYKCPVCQSKSMKDQYENGECEKCGWIFDAFGEKMKNKVVYPNLISLNKAKRLYRKGKSFEPNLDEFIEALFCYSEMQFEYNGTYYAVELIRNNENEVDIELYNSQTKESIIFKTKDNFINNAKVEGELLKQVWDKTTDRYWLQ